MDIQQVSKRAGVSTATVSRVLNASPKVRRETAERVRRIIAELNYVPNSSARNLRIGRSEMFGLIVSDIKNPFFPDLIDEFEALAAARDIDVVFTHTNYNIQRLALCIQRLVERNVDGIAVMASEVDESALQLATQGKVPIVLLNQPSLRSKYSNVLVNYSRGYREVVKLLVKLHHRNIVFLAGPDSLSSVRRRRTAFEAAARKFGIAAGVKHHRADDMRIEGGRAAMESILRWKHRPTALVAANDLLAIGALQATIAAGLSVPQELSIIGFDDLPISSLVQPQLTTLHLSRREIATAAFSQLINMLERGIVTKNANRTVHPMLVVRGSTGPVLRKSRTREDRVREKSDKSR